MVIMTGPAKVPDETSDWQSIDIFVFTNGQQHSPPRKYHLSAQELNWWQAILSFLARSQYGSLNSTVDLYTVTGQKVEGPLELSNGAAYVAVKPLDNFIDTGYSKYLLKASRSWEKSQARRPNSIEIVKPESVSVLTTLSNDHIHISNKIKEEIVAGETVNSTVVSDTKVIERPRALINIHEYPKRDSSSVFKHPDKKRISPAQRSSILRKSTTTPTASKDSARSKDALPRYSKGPLKIDERFPGSNNGGIVKSKIPLKTPPSHLSKSEPVHKEGKDAPYIINESTPTVLPNEDEVAKARAKEDSVLVASIYKNTDSEITSVIVPFCGGHDINVHNKILGNITEESHANEQKLSAEINKTAKNMDLLANPIETSTLAKDLNDQENLSQIQKAPNVSFAEKPENNYVVINNGDIVNLKLQIEVRNGGSVIRKSKTEHKIHSSGDSVKTEKGSQINVDSEMTGHNKSLQSLFVFDNVGIPDKSGAIVVKCACCREKSFNISSISNGSSIDDNRMYVILLPTPGVENNFERCQCDNISAITDTEAALYKQSIINPVKKTESMIALEILRNTADVSEMALTQYPNTARKAVEPKIAEGENANDTKHHVAISDKAADTKNVDTDNSEYNDNKCEISKNSAGIVSKGEKFIDKSIQTELCCLLLEARRHDDGHYSFHLPPLEVLRYYKI